MIVPRRGAPDDRKGLLAFRKTKADADKKLQQQK
jgi:hypothetical protein